ncbi:MAG: MarR family winged helix-turn-helix transcriptional regulator [Gammaproteobacteria bacterium]|nr:MarR family winged helix-turn-helix transcriptional regulator [Gammaproteobacteria bacterium]MBU1444134.1 MarR family winged helix-turn-helix transcriptional regulator [Gammaproteobacteria bacterium]MBU2285176.1 MarR family winged helix-turn-helix transcriptional regulator [Gammaproteobacteria bacterium]
MPAPTALADPLAPRQDVPRARAELREDRPMPALATDLVGWLVTSLSLRLSRSASNYYLERWNIGTTEYRLLLALGIERGCSAVRLAAGADVDKAAASRGLQVLQKEGLVELTKRGREMEIHLTASGEALYEELQAATLRREERLTRGMTPAHVKRLRADLHRLIDNLPSLGVDDDDGL